MLALRSPHTTLPTIRRPRFAHLQLEALEDRNAPASLTLSVTYQKDTNITLSGDLTGTSNNANQMIHIQGVASGQTTTDANGHFSVALAATALGQVSAMYWGQGIACATATVTDPGPQVDVFQALEGAGNVWEFKGHVDYDRPFTNFTVLFWGSPVSVSGKSATTDSSGNFDVFIQLNGTSSDNGSVAAFTYDAWGTQSAYAYQIINQTGT
jgi:hypothetical protein